MSKPTNRSKPKDLVFPDTVYVYVCEILNNGERVLAATAKLSECDDGEVAAYVMPVIRTKRTHSTWGGEIVH